MRLSHKGRFVFSQPLCLFVALSGFVVVANFYDFFNFGKFVKIREFFAEVTNSRYMVWGWGR